MNSVGNWHHSVRKVQQPFPKERLLGWQQQTKAAQVDFTTAKPTDKSGQRMISQELYAVAQHHRSWGRVQKGHRKATKATESPEYKDKAGKMGEHRVMSCDAGNTLGLH
jgi:hypothetical protein